VTDTAVIIFTKAPIPGSVKTRLCPPLTPDEAASLHGTLVLDAVERTKGLSGITLYVACDPGIAHPFFKVLEGRYGARLLPQEGGDLGGRMHGVVQKAFKLGHSRAILTGTDLPTLCRSHFTQAIDDLRTHDIVLGPTLDGGYYLIGLCCPAPDLFQSIAWSTPVVLEETRRKAATLELSVALLPSLRDLDDLEDLNAFIKVAGKDKSLSKRTTGALTLIGERLKERQKAFQK
jgi:rSAM/selenodomain-associated transferase 1